MKQKLDYIMLVDDNKIDNFFHERVIKKYNAAIKVIIKESAKEALYFLQNNFGLPLINNINSKH